MQENHEKSPKSADEQEAPQPVRPTTPDEEAEMDIAGMENPPQAEGPRDERTGGGEAKGGGEKQR